MTANTGRTNAKHITVSIDNPSSLTDVSAYVKSISTIGVNADSTDVTAYSDGIKNFTLGRPDAPIAIKYVFDTAIYAILLAQKAAPTTPLSLNVAFGIRHAYEANEPTFGITSSATSGYLLQNMKVNWDAQEIDVDYIVYGPTAPAFATTAYT